MRRQRAYYQHLSRASRKLHVFTGSTVLRRVLARYIDRLSGEDAPSSAWTIGKSRYMYRRVIRTTGKSFKRHAVNLTCTPTLAGRSGAHADLVEKTLNTSMRRRMRLGLGVEMPRKMPGVSSTELFIPLAVGLELPPSFVRWLFVRLSEPFRELLGVASSS